VYLWTLKESGRPEEIILLTMVDLKYNRKKLPVIRLFVYLIILITVIVFIIRISEIFSFLEALSK
jgi:hypothetical protein